MRASHSSRSRGERNSEWRGGIEEEEHSKFDENEYGERIESSGLHTEGAPVSKQPTYPEAPLSGGGLMGGIIRGQHVRQQHGQHRGIGSSYSQQPWEQSKESTSPI
ncbi:unnamed protein product [Calypogeia fissa]